MAAPSPNDLTRQQLDELDALLQKMLTVPLAADTPPPAASLPAMAQPPLPPSWRIDPPANAPGPSLAQRPVVERALDDPPASLKFEPPASKAPKPTPAPTPAPAPAPAPKPAPVVAPELKITPAPLPAPKPVVVPPPQPKVTPPPVPTALTPAPAVPPVPILFLPFVALNGLFDNICGMFGPPGRLFRSGIFKQLYGFIGLGLVAYTILHTSQVQGWLTLPMALPWPK